MPRAWPIPPAANTLHVVGDTQAVSEGRQAIVLDDMARLTIPDVPYRVQVGDLVGGRGEPVRFPDAIDLLDSMGSGQWWACVGNHDYDHVDQDPSPADAAASMGMPGLNFTVDLGYAVMILTYVRAGTSVDPTPYDPAWLDEELARYPDRLCLIVAHAPLVNSAGDKSPEGDEILAMLANHPQARAWLCGHTHWPIDHPELLLVLETGDHTIAQINASATYYTIPGFDWTDRLCTTWLTVYDDRLEVRFRDHGAHQWVDGPGHVRVWSFPL